MKPKEALDAIVLSLSEIDARLSGEDSPLSNSWEEIKEQLQNELSHYWPAYLETIRGSIAALASSLSVSQSAELAASMKCNEGSALERKLLQRLLSRGKKEKVRYAPFDFAYFCYPLLDFTAYGRVIERTGLYTLRAKVFSAYTSPSGDEGIINTNRIEEILSQEQFEQARTAGWPKAWPAHG
jgi:hypothetical protein